MSLTKPDKLEWKREGSKITITRVVMPENIKPIKITGLPFPTKKGVN